MCVLCDKHIKYDTRGLEMATSEMPSHIIDHVYVGSRQHARGYDILKQLKITHILNVSQYESCDLSYSFSLPKYR